MTRSRHVFGAFALAALVAAAALPRPAAASKADAFEGKIQPVSGQLYRKAGRVELTLGGDLSLNDAFFQKRFGDLKLGYHFTEWLSLSAHGAAGSAVSTSSTTVCPTGQACRPANEMQLNQVPGRIRSLAGLEVAWAPIYGKLNTFSEKVAHIDLSVLAGVDSIAHDEVLSTLQAQAGVEPKQVRTVGGHVGLGLRLFMYEAFALRLDLKDYVYGVTVPNGADGLKSKDFQNQIFAELGVSVFFPFSNRRQP
ncbi:MAG TPA: outer membrane beta-barrel domain-containing protein [Anaeromyxobacteraceae bacterium]|nr:outer membrane beta-barrel domain-containing protein [Anaeromyxobacteraceae bacterium]